MRALATCALTIRTYVHMCMCAFAASCSSESLQSEASGVHARGFCLSFVVPVSTSLHKRLLLHDFGVEIRRRRQHMQVNLDSVPCLRCDNTTPKN